MTTNPYPDFQITGIPLSDEHVALLKTIAIALVDARGEGGATALGNLAWMVENEGRTSVSASNLKFHAEQWRKG